MIYFILVPLAFVTGSIFFFYAGLYYRDLSKKLDDVLTRLPEEQPSAFVTRTDPTFTNENMVSESSVIVTPKSPQLVEWEEQESLRRMNIKPR